MLLKIMWKLGKSRPALAGAAVGAMYFFDPDKGRARRARIGSQAQAAIRRQFGNLQPTPKHLLNRLEGAMPEGGGSGNYHPESDVDLREHVRQVVRTNGSGGNPLNVDVRDGTVALRGEVASDGERARMLAEIKAIEGVTRVEDLTHLPGMVAPNKAPSVDHRR